MGTADSHPAYGRSDDGMKAHAVSAVRGRLSQRPPTRSPLLGRRLVVTVSSSLSDAGLASVLISGTSLFHHGIQTVILAIGGARPGHWDDMVRRTPGVQLWPVALPPDVTPHDLSDEIRKISADVALLHDATLVGTMRSRVPILVSCATSDMLRWQALHPGEPAPAPLAEQAAHVRAGLLAAHRVIAPSHSFALALAREHRLPAMPTVLIPAVPRILSQRPPGRGFVLSAGRFCDEALDFETLDRAAELIGDAVVLAGPALRPEDARCVFTNLQTQGGLTTSAIDRLMGQAPVFVSCARHRSFGRLILSAALQGCALVLSDIPVHREIWDGAADFVACGDADGFARGMRRGLEDELHRTKMAESAQKRAMVLTARAMGDGLHEILAEVCMRAALTAAE